MNRFELTRRGKFLIGVIVLVGILSVMAGKLTGALFSLVLSVILIVGLLSILYTYGK